VGRAAGFDSAFAALEAPARTAYTRVEAKKGQTMASAAAAAGLTARVLKWYNPKVTTPKSGRLRPGQTLLVPSRAVVSAALDIPDPAIEIYGSSSRAGSRTHVVRRGETLGGIARKYGTSASAIVRLNGLRKQVIYPGQELRVRAARAPAKQSASKSAPKRGAKAAPSKGTTSSVKSSASKAVARQ
jgi:membrane-bound lytic murein transglycosylase D